MTRKQLTERLDALLEEAGEVTPPGQYMSGRRLFLLVLAMQVVWETAEGEGVTLSLSEVGEATASFRRLASHDRR